MVLRRELAREQDRLKKEAEEKERRAPIKVLNQPLDEASSSSRPVSPDSVRRLLERRQSTLLSTMPITRPSGRRQSNVSHSALHRSSFPLKLDLSASALGFNANDLTQSALASPVTLAPKTGLRSAAADMMPDIMSAFPPMTGVPGSHNQFDLELGPLTQSDAKAKAGLQALGNSADNAIDLDLNLDDVPVDVDSLDIFGDDPPTNDVGDIFSGTTGESSTSNTTNANNNVGDFLESLKSDDPNISSNKLATPQFTDATGQAESPASMFSGLVAAASHDSSGAPAGSFDLGSLDMAEVSRFTSTFLGEPSNDTGFGSIPGIDLTKSEPDSQILSFDWINRH